MCPGYDVCISLSYICVYIRFVKCRFEKKKYLTIYIRSRAQENTLSQLKTSPYRNIKNEIRVTDQTLSKYKTIEIQITLIPMHKYELLYLFNVAHASQTTRTCIHFAFTILVKTTPPSFLLQAVSRHTSLP